MGLMAVAWKAARHAVQDRPDQTGVRLSFERMTAARHFIKDATEGTGVRPLIVLSFELLTHHLLERAGDGSLEGHTPSHR